MLKELTIEEGQALLVTVEKLGRDLIKAIQTDTLRLSRADIRFIVDLYYQQQKLRKATTSQLLAIGDEPKVLVSWFLRQAETVENQIKRALAAWTNKDPISQWAKSIIGINSIIAAGLAAHVWVSRDQTNTVGKLWSLAGQDPRSVWLGDKKAKKFVADVKAEFQGKKKPTLEQLLLSCCEKTQKKPESVRAAMLRFAPKPSEANLVKALAFRPWNARLKTLCWKIGESFVKVKGNPDSWYGRLYRQRKEWESARNMALEFKDQAAKALRDKDYKRDTDAKKEYEQGRLPPAHIHARAKRYAVKMFLAHYHEVAYITNVGEDPPKPWCIAYGEHVDWIRASEVS